MTQKQCEVAILEHLCAIRDIYHEYNPGGDYLSMNIGAVENETIIYANNAYWDEDSMHPVDAVKIIPRKKCKAKHIPLPDIYVGKDILTGYIYINVDGVTRYEHLTEDEAAEVLHELLSK